jgi:hypothetical protein
LASKPFNADTSPIRNNVEPCDDVSICRRRTIDDANQRNPNHITLVVHYFEEIVLDFEFYGTNPNPNENLRTAVMLINIMFTVFLSILTFLCSRFDGDASSLKNYSGVYI